MRNFDGRRAEISGRDGEVTILLRDISVRFSQNLTGTQAGPRFPAHDREGGDREIENLDRRCLQC